MNKRILYDISTIAVCILLTGCGHEHTWKEATCTEPKTCSECGEIEGEPLTHTWVDATCAEPKHCSLCGETEGEPLAHTWVDATCKEAKHCSVCGETEGEPLAHTLTEANYQQPATCEVCGETVGEPLEAYFEKYELVCNAELDTEYTFTVPCYENPEYTTVEKITFSDYKVFESDETHEAKDGYEWRAVTLTWIFDDENAYKYGYEGMATNIYDYYDEAWNETDISTFNYNGIDYEECVLDWQKLQDSWEGDAHIGKARYFFHTPIGYDGLVITEFRREYVKDGQPPYIRELAKHPEDYLCFRLK